MRNPVRLLIFSACLALVPPASALPQESRPIISVLDFESTGIARGEVKIFIDYVSSHIMETGRYRVIDRRQREAILEEIAFSQSDCTDEQCQLEIGRLLSANQIIVGSIGKVGGRYILNIKLIEVETGETLATASEMYGSLDALLDDSKALVARFLGRKPAGEAQPAAAEGPAKSPAAPPAAKPPVAQVFPAAAERRGGALELGVGYTFVPTEEDYSTDGGFSLSAGYLYQASRGFSLGVTAHYTAVTLDWMGSPIPQDVGVPNLLAKAVIGNKVDGAALSVGMGVSLASGYDASFCALFGFYFRNILLHSIASVAIKDGREEWALLSVEAGYSLFFRKKAAR